MARPCPAPLTTPCPPQETCFSQIRAGLLIYHSSLATIQALLPGHTGLVETLQLDMANLSSNIQQLVRGQRGDFVEMGWVKQALHAKERMGRMGLYPEGWVGMAGMGGQDGAVSPGRALWGRGAHPGLDLMPLPLPGCRWRTRAWPQ